MSIRRVPRLAAAFLSTALASSAVFGDSAAPSHASFSGTLPNNFPILNEAGAAATYSTDGFVDLRNPFHTRKGNNGRTCESCHLPSAGWSIRPVDVELRFLLTGGRDPLFNLLDANSPTAPTNTLAQRYASFSMLRKGLFRRGGDIDGGADFEITEFDDPLGAGASFTKIQAFRRPLATANFHIARNVGWHDQNTNGTGDMRTGLTNQASGAFSGALGGPAAPEDAVASVVRYEEGLRFAQSYIFGLGALDSCGARGGSENLSSQPPVNGRFDLFDAWIDLVPGSCTTKAADRKRAQIARGQQLFNEVRDGKSCRGCHNAANNGSNVNGTLFDIGASRPKYRKPGMPLYTLTNKSTGDKRITTDPGRAIKSGRWDDIDKFKTPSLRGLAARAPYFHNGIAATLKDVVRHYEVELGFKFTPQERDDLVAFMEAL
jgi:cytochrome c peroxidase